MFNSLLLFDFAEFWKTIGPSVVEAGKSLGLALVVLFIGLSIAGRITKGFGKVMESRDMDASLRPFLKSLVGTILKVLVLLAAASTLGMEVTSFVAILSAAAFAVGMALQGSLANFAGGVLILVFKPFKVGDLVSAQGFTGNVKEIQVFNTLLVTLDNQIIILPNGAVSNGAIQNLTMAGTRGVDLTFGISYNADIDKARTIIQQVANACPQITEPEKTTIFVGELADSAVNFAVRPWTKPEHWWDVYFYMHEHVKKEFDKAGVEMPFPQMDVHVHKNA
ncbi:MAG: mechanosensitive ion channel [Aureispira sp.]|nr:mechanosensitive ion channel [Aureispira sp.]